MDWFELLHHLERIVDKVITANNQPTWLLWITALGSLGAFFSAIAAITLNLYNRKMIKASIGVYSNILIKTNDDKSISYYYEHIIHNNSFRDYSILSITYSMIKKNKCILYSIQQPNPHADLNFFNSGGSKILHFNEIKLKKTINGIVLITDTGEYNITEKFKVVDNIIVENKNILLNLLKESMITQFNIKYANSRKFRSKKRRLSYMNKLMIKAVVDGYENLLLEKP